MSVAQRRAAPESFDWTLRGDASVEHSSRSSQSSSTQQRKSAKWRTINYDAFGSGDKESEYTQFPDPTSIAAYNASTFLRAAQVGFAIFVCVVSSGIVCGFAALKPILIAEGVYADLCPPDWSHSDSHSNNEPCAAQDMRLNLFFIVASVTLNVSTAFAGFTLDKRGRRVCYLVAAAVLAIGSLLMAAAFTHKLPPWLDGFLIGNLLLGLGGTYIFVPSFQLANAFPRYTGVILALVTGAFDASAAVFLFYRMAYEASDGQFKPQHFFLAYGVAVPLMILVAELTFMPRFAYHSMPQIQRRLDRAQTSRYDVHDSDDELATDLLRREARAGRAQARRAKLERIETVTGGSRERQRREDRLERRQAASGIWGVLHDLPVGRQMATLWFALMLVLTMLQMLRMNYFIATVRAQYRYMLDSEELARRVNNLFDVALPVAGVVSTPLIGWLLNELSVTVILAVLSGLIVVLGVLNCMPYLWAGYLTVIAFVFFRPLFYSTMSDYVTKVFGFATFGRIYGTITCASGLSNIIQPALDALTHGPLRGSPVPINVFFAASGTVVSLSLTLYVYVQGGAFRQQQQKQLQQQQFQENEDGERASLLPQNGTMTTAPNHDVYGTLGA